MTIEEIRALVARELLRIGAVVFSPDDPFTWASGLRSPVYCDNRLTMSHPEVRSLITDGFEALMEHHVLRPEVVVGTATAGIPHAAWLAHRLNKPLAYVRSSAKQHGRRNRVEGRIDPGQRVVVVEDLISTGGSSLEAARVAQEAGAAVEAVLAIFNYMLPSADQAFRDESIRLAALTDFKALLIAATEEGLLAPDVVVRMRNWHERLGREPASLGDG